MKKLDKETKYKLIYSGELGLFAIIFLVFSILKFTGTIVHNDTRALVFNWITIFGATWGVADFIWALASKKRQQRISMLDKLLLLPLSIFIITYDLICFIVRPEPAFYNIMLGSAFAYVAVVYSFEAVYHFYHPIPGLLDDEEEETEEKTENSQEKPEK